MCMAVCAMACAIASGECHPETGRHFSRANQTSDMTSERNYSGVRYMYEVHCN